MPDDLKWAIDSFRDQKRYGDQGGYAIAQNYYEGRHRLQFATEKYKQTFGTLFRAFCDNLTPAVIDSLVDRLEVTGSVSPDLVGSDSRRDEEEPLGDPAAERAWAIWQRNQMDSRSSEVHREAFLAGDGYVIVEPRPEGAVIWPQPARQMAVQYDDTNPGVITRAAKLWKTQDGFLRLTLFFPDRTERYVSRRSTKSTGRRHVQGRGLPALRPVRPDRPGRGRRHPQRLRADPRLPLPEQARARVRRLRARRRDPDPGRAEQGDHGHARRDGVRGLPAAVGHRHRGRSRRGHRPAEAAAVEARQRPLRRLEQA